MLENLKKYWPAIAAALASIIVLLGYVITGGTGDPLPQPSPSITVSPLPSPTVSPTPSPTPGVSLKLMTNMVDGFEFVADNATLPVAPNGLAFDISEITDVVTTIPTYKGARVGAYGDALLQTTVMRAGKRYWLDVRGVAAGHYSFNVAGTQVNVEVAPNIFSWPVPLYMEMQFAAVSQANGLADVGETYAQRIALNQKYAAILRAHGVEPIKQNVFAYPPTNFGDTFKTLVLDNRIAGPCLFGPSPQIAPSVALLQAIEAALRSGALPANSYVYAWDEGEGSATDTAAALARVKYIKQYVPSLKVMVTRQYSAEFAPYVDIFVPVINWFNQPGFVPASAYANDTVWLYHSCMSANRCNNATSAAAVDQLPTRFPMQAIDAPETDPERFVIESVAAGARGLLYYNTTESIGTAHNVGGQYKFGNNGDGNLLYPNLGYSKRLKYYRRGLNKVALQRAGL